LLGLGVVDPVSTFTSFHATKSTLETLAVTFSTIVTATDLAVTTIGSFFKDNDWYFHRMDNWTKLEWGRVMYLFTISEFDKGGNALDWGKQIVNYLTLGEQMQSQIGNGVAHWQNIWGHVDEVGYHKGRTTIRLSDGYIGQRFHNGVSYGHYVMGHNMALNPNDTDHDVHLFAHEFGHTYQSRASGPFYLFRWGIPSAAGKSEPEINANWKAYYNFGINPSGKYQLDLSDYGSRGSGGSNTVPKRRPPTSNAYLIRFPF